MLTIVSSKIVTAYEFDKGKPNMRLKGISHWRVVAKTPPDHPYPGTLIQNTFMLRHKALKFYKEMAETIPDAKLYAIMDSGLEGELEAIDVTPSMFKLKTEEEQEVSDTALPESNIPESDLQPPEMTGTNAPF